MPLATLVREHSVKLAFVLLGTILTGTFQLWTRVGDLESDHKVINTHTIDFEKNLDQRLARIEIDVREIRNNQPASPVGGLSTNDRRLLREVLDSIARRNCFESGGQPGDNTPLCRGIR